MPFKRFGQFSKYRSFEMVLQGSLVSPALNHGRTVPLARAFTIARSIAEEIATTPKMRLALKVSPSQNTELLLPTHY